MIKLKDLITEGGDGILEPIQKAKSQRDAMNYVKKFLKDENSYGWNDNKNWKGAVDEYHKEIFKFVDEYAKTSKKARKMLDKTHNIFKKWRKTDGSKAGD